MTENMPHDIEVRYILPALRRAFTKVLSEDNQLSQKEIAELLGLTEGAVSQYIHDKRGNEVTFSENIRNEIKKSIIKIQQEDNKTQRIIAEFYKIMNLMELKEIVCDIHRKQSKDLEDCTICFDEGLIN